ncbi:MAG: VacJ family lipoprotein [Rubrivivax sp.]
MNRLALPLRRSALALLASTLLAGGCATVAQPNPADPLEGWNRSVSGFNDAIDDAVLQPVARTYRDVVPAFVRTGVGNFFGNLADGWSAVNHLLQGKLESSANMSVRFGLNTTLGLAGVIDIAREAGLEPEREDFGQTLGRWGIGPGPYLVWPLLGPSTLRDSVARPLDTYATSPALYGLSEAEVLNASVLDLVHTRSTLLDATKLLDSVALDRYSFLRDAYLARRRNLVHDGNPPELPSAPSERFDLPAPPAAAASAAPAK